MDYTTASVAASPLGVTPLVDEPETSSEVAVLEEARPIARRRSQRGMVSAEWAVGIIAAIGIAGVLLSVVTSGPVQAGIPRVILAIIAVFANGVDKLG